MNAVVDMLFEHPIIQPGDIMKHIGVTDATARNILRQLTEIGILVKTKYIRPAIWIAEELIDISRPTWAP